MAKKNKTLGFKIVVEPYARFGNITKRDVEDMRDQILRHVDNVNPNYVNIEEETEDVCSYCGAQWTEDSSDYNGGCCGRDEANNPTVGGDFEELQRHMNDMYL